MPDRKTAPLRKLILVVVCSHGIFALSQQLENDQFKIGLSPAGVASLKHGQDVFDTDYILGGRSLGDVLIRYREAGEAWQEISSGTSVSQRAPGEVTYQIGRAVPTIATASRANSSIGPWRVRALNDQAEPKNSRDKEIPFFAWGDRHGTEEWVEYNFHEPKQVSSVEVYWAIGSYEDYKWDLPVSWKIQYRDGDQWREVHTSDKYGIAPDQFNHVSFESVTTSALRLLAILPQDATSGIYEWRVNTEHGKDIESVPDMAATGAFRLEG